MKNIFSVLLLVFVVSCLNISYSQARNIGHLNKVQDEVKNFVSDIDKYNEDTFKALFKMLGSDENLLKHSEARSEISRALILCKRDLKCTILSHKSSFKMMMKIKDKQNQLNDKEVEHLYSTMEDLHYIINETASAFVELQPRDTKEAVAFVHNIRQSDSINTFEILNKLKEIYDFNYPSSKAAYGAGIIACFKKNKPCINDEGAFQQTLLSLKGKHNKQYIVDYERFFRAIDKVDRIALAEIEVQEAKKQKEKQKLEVAKQKEKQKLEVANQKRRDLIKQDAISKGYKGYNKGFNELLHRIKIGIAELKDEMEYLWLKSEFDSFKVEGIVGDFVVYVDRDGDKLVVIKEKNKIYTQGTLMGNNYFSISGVQEFQTVMGAVQQLIVLKEIDRY